MCGRTTTREPSPASRYARPRSRGPADHNEARMQARSGLWPPMAYALIETCKFNDADPQAWLADVLARLCAVRDRRATEQGTLIRQWQSSTKVPTPERGAPTLPKFWELPKLRQSNACPKRVPYTNM
jgi:IS66 C-terminal element